MVKLKNNRLVSMKQDLKINYIYAAIIFIFLFFLGYYYSD